MSTERYLQIEKRYYIEDAETIIVTRHDALVEYIRELGMADDATRVLSHATAEDVKGNHVIGVLPPSLACLAYTMTEVPLRLTPEMRGKELTLDEVRACAGEPRTYRVVPL